jgi:glycosyltransferase involved in cell wall biosynthesis
MRPQISVIIPAYYSDSGIAGCLEALRSQSFREFEAIVVNSSPGDRTREIVTTQFPEVRYVESATRLLPHAARNAGVQLAVGRLLVFTDADCRGERDWLERIVQAQAAGHEVVCGAIEPNESGWFAMGVHLCKYSFRLSGLPEGPSIIAGTANAAYSRKVWEAVGPFDGDKFSGDGLLGWRAARAGWQPWFEPKAIIRHTFHHSPAAFFRERVARGIDFAYTRTDFERWSGLRLLTTIAAFPLLPFLQLARGGRDAFRSGWGVYFVLTVPLQYLGHCGWSVGEARVHCRLFAAKIKGPGTEMHSKRQ